MVVGHIKISPDPPIRFTADGASAQQQMEIVIEPSFDRSLIVVNPSPRGGPFSWPAAKAVVEPGTQMRVPVTFTPVDAAPVEAALTIDARHPDFFGRRQEFPVVLRIEGNAKNP
jgi:hypothetical protein